MSRSKKTKNEDRCEISELMPSECEHCRRADKSSRGEPDEDNRPILGAIVVAEYDGVCQECGEVIVVGDHIGLIDEVQVKGEEDKVKRWAHYGCGR